MARAKEILIKGSNKVIVVKPEAPPFRPRDRKKGEKYVVGKTTNYLA